MHIRGFKTSIVLFILVLFTIPVFSQSVSGVQASIVDDQLQIVYRISGLQAGQQYRVRLYSSIDSYQDPITDGVEGAVGEDLTLTTNNIITIPDPITSLGPITGDISFRVRADLTYFPVSLNSGTNVFSTKRGKNFTISWNGGLATDMVQINLYRNLNLVQENLYNSLNSNVAEFKMPKQLELGEGYNMRLNFTHLDNAVETADFEIKRKKSIGGRVATWAILLGGAGYLATQGGTGGGEEEDPLPDPPGIPTDFVIDLIKGN